MRTNCLDHTNVPDMSCEFETPIAYTEMILDHLTHLGNYEKNGTLILSDFTAKAWIGMLSGVKNHLDKVNDALYSDNELPILKAA